MDAAEMQAWLEEADPETSAFEISRESFTEMVKYMQSLSAELTSAKEEIERLKGENEDLLNLVRKLQDNCLIHHERALAAESLLASERKETERLRYELNQIFGMACDAPELNMSNYDVDQVAALNAAMVEIWQTAKAALQSRQGEE